MDYSEVERIFATRHISRYDSGNTKLEYITIKGMLNGIYKEYYDSPGKNKRAECYFVNGKLSGQYYEFYENGNIKNEWTYRDDVIVGCYRHYYEDVKDLLKIEVEKLDEYGNLDGRYILFHKNKKIKVDCVIEKGIFNGPCKEYYDNGNLSTICSYLNGVLHGIYMEFNEKGEKILDCDAIDLRDLKGL